METSSIARHLIQLVKEMPTTSKADWSPRLLYFTPTTAAGAEGECCPPAQGYCKRKAWENHVGPVIAGGARQKREDV